MNRAGPTRATWVSLSKRSRCRVPAELSVAMQPKNHPILARGKNGAG